MVQELCTMVFFLVLLKTVGLLPWQKKEMGFETRAYHFPRLIFFCISNCLTNLTIVASGSQTSVFLIIYRRAYLKVFNR